MGAWIYCEKCESPMKRANLKEVILGYSKCKNCETERYISDFEKESVLDEVVDLLERLEENNAS